MINPADITFCVKTFNRPQLLFRCLKSLRYYSPESPVIVCDDSTAEYGYPTKLKEQITVLRPHQMIGLSAGRNLLVAAAETPFCFILDDDHGLRTRSRWRESLKITKTYSTGIVGWPLINDSGKLKGGFEFLIRHPRGGGNPKTVAIVPAQHGSCDMVVNNFLAPTELLRAHPWPEALKTREHFTWFWDLSRKWRRPPIHVLPDDFAWLHMSSPESLDPVYRLHRRAGDAQQAAALRERGIDRIIWCNQAHTERASPPIPTP